MKILTLNNFYSTKIWKILFILINQFNTNSKRIFPHAKFINASKLAKIVLFWKIQIQHIENWLSENNNNISIGK